MQGSIFLCFRVVAGVGGEDKKFSNKKRTLHLKKMKKIVVTFIITGFSFGAVAQKEVEEVPEKKLFKKENCFDSGYWLFQRK